MLQASGSDLAPQMLQLCNISPPNFMTSTSLVLYHRVERGLQTIVSRDYVLLNIVDGKSKLAAVTIQTLASVETVADGLRLQPAQDEFDIVLF